MGFQMTQYDTGGVGLLVTDVMQRGVNFIYDQYDAGEDLQMIQYDANGGPLADDQIGCRGGWWKKVCTQIHCNSYYLWFHA